MKAWWPTTLFAANALLLAVASPALADVKAGVDAWSAGDYARAVAEWRGPAAKGDPDALFNLAQAYRLGRGVPVDMKQAESLYAQAAAKGHLKAADNYGLLLFQNGRRTQALPYIETAAGRGDPRAQYLLGIARFNGKLVPKDWVEAYALLTLANAAGLPQAKPAISQMDEYIPLAQRQAAQSLAIKMRQEADTTRASQMAAADLGAETTQNSGLAANDPSSALPSARMPQPVQSVAVAPSTPATQPVPVRMAAQTPEPTRAAPPDGPWKVQLGAFSVAGNADRLWSRISRNPALAGKSRQTVPAGRLTKLLAVGWPSRNAARAACQSLKVSGQVCLVTR